MLGTAMQKSGPSKYWNCILISEGLCIIFLIGYLYTVSVTGFSFNPPVTFGLVLTGLLSGYFVSKDRSELSENDINVTSSSTIRAVVLSSISVTLYTLVYLYERNSKISEWHNGRSSSRAEIEAATTEIRSVIDETRDLVETETIDTAEEQLESIDPKISEYTDAADNYQLDDLHDELLRIDAERRYLLNEIDRVRHEQRRQRLQDDIDTVTTELDEIEQLVDEGAVDAAAEKLEEIESDIEPIADAVDRAQSGVFRDVRRDLVQLRERREELLDKVSRKQQDQQYQRRRSQIDSIATELDEIKQLIDIDSADHAKARPEDPDSDSEPIADGIGQEQSEESEVIRDDLTQLRERREELLDEINRKQQEQRHQHRSGADSTTAELDEGKPPIEEEPIEEARRRLEELKSDIESVDVPDSQPESETVGDVRSDVDQVEDGTEEPLSRADEEQREQDRRDLEERIAVIDSELDGIESSIEAGEIDTAQTRIEQAASKLGSVETCLDAYDAGVFEDIRTDAARLTDRGETLLDELRARQRENKRQTLEDELETLRSELDRVDAVTADGSPEEAESKLEELAAKIESVAEESRQHDFNDLREKVETLDQTRERKLEEVTRSTESTTAPTESSQAPTVSAE